MLRAEAAGAVAVAIVSNEEAWMNMGEDGVHWPTIPSAHLPRSEGNALRQAMRAAAEAGEAARGELRLLQAPDQALVGGACPAHGGSAVPGQAQLLPGSSRQCQVQEPDEGGCTEEREGVRGSWEEQSCSAEGRGSGGVQSVAVDQLQDGALAAEQQGAEVDPAALQQQEGVQLEGLATEGLAAQVERAPLATPLVLYFVSTMSPLRATACHGIMRMRAAACLATPACAPAA